MKILLAFTTIIFFTAMHTFAQTDSLSALPFAQIPAYPETYSAGTVAARMVDALGFRYYWATEGLREEDLTFRPSEDARTTGETVDHVYGLSMMVLRAITQGENVRQQPPAERTFAETREATLKNLLQASEILKASDDATVEKMEIVSGRGDNSTTFPFWNVINGPLVDAIYHVGQVVSFRRASGNPMNPKVSVFLGNVRE